MNIIRRVLSGKSSKRYPLHVTQTPVPFFIVGSGRCGTTLLRRELSNAASVHIPPETFALPDAIKVFKESTADDWDDIVEQVLAKFDYHPEFGYFELPSLRALAYELKKLPIEDRCLEKIITGIYQYHAKFHGQEYEIWGDKTPMHVWHMSAIKDVYPNAKFIHLIRDGVDVVNSYVKTREDYTIEQAAKRWAGAIQSFISFSNLFPENCHTIRYEDLVVSPIVEVEKLCQFLSISYDLSNIDQLENVNKMGDVAVLKHHENVFNPISTSSIGKGRAVYSQEERKILHKLIGSELKNNNYPPV